MVVWEKIAKLSSANTKSRDSGQQGQQGLLSAWNHQATGTQSTTRLGLHRSGDVTFGGWGPESPN